jgi:glycosyltransferase involved in cell wall biosynthesis
MDCLVQLISMSDPPILSVVIPCLNQARFLRAALRSVAAQTCRPIETIVVDDGSTDETSAVAREAGAILLRQPNSGVSAARNRGLRDARGRFVIYLDADDELEPDAALTGVTSLERHRDAWMVARCCVLIDEAGTPMASNCLPPGSPDLYREWLERNLVWTPGAAVFRREEFAALGGFPPDVGPAADYAVYLELARLRRVVFEERNAVRYRQHRSNMSRDGARMLKATMDVLRRERTRLPPEYEAAFRRGLTAWQVFYGDQIIQQLRIDVRARRFGRQQLHAVVLLLKECPEVALMHFWRKLRRVAGGHPPAEVEPGRFSAVDVGRPSSVETAEVRR